MKDDKLASIMNELEDFGNESTKKIFMKHGAPEPFFGVKVQDLKKIQKRIKKDHPLALALYNTGNGDAMYLAGLIADEKQMDRKTLDNWVNNASWYMISEYTVPWIAADSGLGWSCGLEWIEAKDPKVASSGWAALAAHLSVCSPESTDIPMLKKLIKRVASEIENAPNRVRYTMNGFLIAAGSYVESLSSLAMETAARIGKVHVEMAGTACKVPDAATYIKKVADKGRTGKKRKMARC